MSELRQLTVDYAKQETIAPLKNLGRYLVFGIAGALCLGIGLTFWTIAMLRALQTETGSTFAGDWSWAPYLITLAASVVIIGLSLWAIGKERRAAERRKAKRASDAAAASDVTGGHG